jgi:tyrosinase
VSTIRTGSTKGTGDPAMDIRKNAVELLPAERDAFLEAVIRLKQRPAPGGPASASVYDQFVALHGAVMAVVAPGLPPGDTINFGHWNIGFCPWHRKYLREFERALQKEVPGVTLPYWNWVDHVGAVTKLFTADFLGALHVGTPQPLTSSVFRNPVPPAQRPPWWPAGATGFRIHPALQDGFGNRLARGSVGVSWPPLAPGIDKLENLVVQVPNVHPLWYFWVSLEQGSQITSPATHNRAHNFVGGHMSQAFSPNDPVFWLHHANVDRLWASWQEKRRQAVPGSTFEDHWPPVAQHSPFTSGPAPLGHRLNDAMWPWVGTAPGYSVMVAPAVKPLLPSFTGAPAVTVKEVLNTEAIDAVGYRYASPS